MLPPPFIRQMQQLLGPEFPAFETALQAPPPVSIRLNAAKQPADPGLLPALDSPVPWCPDGFYLPERPVFTLDPLFHAGAYYVQEASSMFLDEALRQTVDFSRRLRVLDLCAAPGGKSTLAASRLGPGSLLVANEVIRSRVGVLRENLEKWGLSQVAVCSAEAEEIAALEGWFDVIVTDAPCSGEGLFRKDPDAIREWSPAQVDLCAGRQRRILTAAVHALAPGGVLLYSTCTYNRAENEENTEWLVREFALEPLRLELPAEWGVVATGGGYRFFPHRLRGEGFFLAALRKTDDGPVKPPSSAAAFKSIQPLSKALIPAARPWLHPKADARLFQTPGGDVLALSATLENDYLILDKILKNKWFGVNIGEIKGKDLVPSHALSLNGWVSPERPGVELSREQALLFLKKETFDLPPGTPQGWTLGRYGGLNLGWMKVLSNRFNNYLPVERRIRMQVK